MFLALQEGRHWLVGSAEPVVWTDHENLLYRNRCSSLDVLTFPCPCYHPVFPRSLQFGCTRRQCFHQPPAGLLNPLVVPCCPWSHITVDFVTGFPPLDGNTAILTVVDHFSKAFHFIPLTNAPFDSRDWGSPGLTCFPSSKIPFHKVWRPGEMYGCPEPYILECISDLGGVFPYPSFCCNWIVSLHDFTGVAHGNLLVVFLYILWLVLVPVVLFL